MGTSVPTTKVVFDNSITARIAEDARLPENIERIDKSQENLVGVQSVILNAIARLVREEDISTALNIRIRT